MVDFFCYKKIILKYKERMVFEMNVIKQELQFEEGLKQRLKFICNFSKAPPTFIIGKNNSYIRSKMNFAIDSKSKR